MKKLITAILIFISISAYSQSWTAIGTPGMQRLISGSDTTYRFSNGSYGFTYFKSLHAIKQYIAEISSEQPDGVVSQGVISINDGTYLVTVSTPFEVRFNNVVITTDITPDNTVQLTAPDATYARIDVVYANEDGSYGFVTGTAGEAISRPAIPEGTILLSEIFRNIDGTNTIINQVAAEYYSKNGGVINGGVQIASGNDLSLIARNNNSDPGDLIFKKMTDSISSEVGRMWYYDLDSAIYVRYGIGENGGLGYEIARSNDLALKADLLRIPGNFVTPEMYGAIPNGVFDCTPAIVSAVASGKPVYFGNGIYLTTGNIELPSFASIEGFGGNKTTIKTVSNNPIFLIKGGSITIQNIYLSGSGKTSGLTNQHGISLNGDGNILSLRFNVKIESVTFSDFGGAGYYSKDHVGGSTNRGSALIANCYARSSNIGYFLDTRSEYNSISNSTAEWCTTGYIVKGGNNTWTGGQMADCATNVFIGTSANDGHGMIVGAKINHGTTYNIQTDSLVLGFLFQGCMIYQGNSYLANSNNLKFADCDFGMSGNTLSIINSTNTVFNNASFVAGNPTLITTGSTDITWTDCNFLNGTVPAGVNNIRSMSNILGTQRAGQLEYDGSDLYFTKTTTRQKLATEAVVSTLTANTVTTNANLTGDVTSVGNATTLATVNSNIGTFTNATVTANAKGQVTAIANGAAFIEDRAAGTYQNATIKLSDGNSGVINSSTSDGGWSVYDNTTGRYSIVRKGGIDFLDAAGYTTVSRGKITYAATTGGFTREINYNVGTTTANRSMDFLGDVSGKIPVVGFTAPASSTDTGEAGEVRYTSTYNYFCYATNQWSRVSVSSVWP